MPHPTFLLLSHPGGMSVPELFRYNDSLQQTRLAGFASLQQLNSIVQLAGMDPSAPDGTALCATGSASSLPCSQENLHPCTSLISASHLSHCANQVIPHLYVREFGRSPEVRSTGYRLSHHALGLDRVIILYSVLSPLIRLNQLVLFQPNPSRIPIH
jgi:hypothetical protein